VSRLLAIAFLSGLVAAGVGHAQGGRKKEIEQKEYKSAKYKFRAYFPEKDPKVETRKLKIDGGEMDQSTASVEHRDGVYSVSVTVLPDPAVLAGEKAVLDGVRDGIKGKDDKALHNEVEIEQNTSKTPGRELLFDFRKNQLRTRVFLVENRLYQVTVTGSKSVVTGDTAGKFLAAFEVTK
jgi:hypothetical protein